ncbi:MAG: hypothetical protein JWO25_3345, partial [Alphaproteobacteria bacterium]|nr:hypothetical protein [Alphaproteobacteria bacterium]
YAAIVLFALAARKARVRSGDLEPPATIH